MFFSIGNYAFLQDLGTNQEPSNLKLSAKIPPIITILEF